MKLFSAIKEGLKKTKQNFTGKFSEVIGVFTKIDEELFEELEELLILSDVGAGTSQKICSELRAKVKAGGVKDPDQIKELLKDILINITDGDNSLNMNSKPAIVLIIGVNGVGKTTTIGKLAEHLRQQGKSVILAAGDTFRAGAIAQLEIWASRAKADLVKSQEGSDPGAVIYDTISAAKSRGKDVIICDTAGRLHNKKHLLDELQKINRIIARELPGSAKEVLLVLDATTGQNAINQAKEFGTVAEITGIALTKLDGTAKGGVTLAIKEELGIPVKFIGVGEQINDLHPFCAAEFVEALF